VKPVYGYKIVFFIVRHAAGRPAGRPVGAANYPVLMVLDCFLLRYSGPSKKGGPHYASLASVKF
jgi:hypothetical protein